MSTIKNVTLVGGSGRLGSFILDKLLASGKFNVQLLRRAGSSSSQAANTKIVEVDFADIESLTAAFKDQDAIVSAVGDAGVLGQKLMVDAAIAAGVKQFLPSNFGSNMANVNSRKLPVFGAKVAVEDYLVEKSKSTDLAYTFVYVGGLIDFTLENKVIMDFSKYEPVLYYGGNTEFSATSMSTVGDAVVGVLSHPAETRNRPVYVSEIIVSQRQLLSVARKLAPSRPWAPATVDLDGIYVDAQERFVQGQHDLGTIISLLLKSILDPEYGPKFVENDNDLLGIKGKTEEYLVELLTPLIP